MSDLKNAYRIWHIENFRVEPDGAAYEAVCTSDLPPLGNHADVLDAIYEGHQNGIGDLNPPRTRSLSVGDVVQLFDEHGVSTYRRVVNVGFERVRRVNLFGVDTFEKVGQ